MQPTICLSCGREGMPEGAAYCPYCGGSLAQESPVPEEIQRVLNAVEQQRDPVKKRAMLLDAQSRWPDSLDIAQELLFLGRLHERNPHKLDFSVIKCYLWQMYLTPKDFSEETKQQMREELFHHPDLERCRQLFGDAEAYTRRYLKRLACEFVALFLKGSNHYTGTLFGFRLDNRMSRVLAKPAAEMIYHIRKDEALTVYERSMLAGALYQAFLTETGSESRWVDEQLGKLNEPIPGKGGAQ